jgi:hypothetical protein
MARQLAPRKAVVVDRRKHGPIPEAYEHLFRSREISEAEERAALKLLPRVSVCSGEWLGGEY